MSVKLLNETQSNDCNQRKAMAAHSVDQATDSWSNHCHQTSCLIPVLSDFQRHRLTADQIYLVWKPRITIQSRDRSMWGLWRVRHFFHMATNSTHQRITLLIFYIFPAIILQHTHGSVYYRCLPHCLGFFGYIAYAFLMKIIIVQYACHNCCM